MDIFHETSRELMKMLVRNTNKLCVSRATFSSSQGFTGLKGQVALETRTICPRSENFSHSSGSDLGPNVQVIKYWENFDEASAENLPVLCLSYTSLMERPNFKGLLHYVQWSLRLFADFQAILNCDIVPMFWLERRSARWEGKWYENVNFKKTD